MTFDMQAMKTCASTRSRGSLQGLLRVLPLVAWLACGAAQAQYKVIGPNGKVTYSDREPNAVEGRVTELGARTPVPSAEPDLPFELRQIVSRFPVTLYTTAGACEPCDSGRALLRQRGVPFSERQITSAEDGDALERLSGARDAPTLAIGSQMLRGLASDVWMSYLDAAGYPRESQLPANYQNRPATPLVQRREATATRPAPARADTTPAAPVIAPGAPGAIKF